MQGLAEPFRLLIEAGVVLAVVVHHLAAGAKAPRVPGLVSLLPLGGAVLLIALAQVAVGHIPGEVQGQLPALPGMQGERRGQGGPDAAALRVLRLAGDALPDGLPLHGKGVEPAAGEPVRVHLHRRPL